MRFRFPSIIVAFGLTAMGVAQDAPTIEGRWQAVELETSGQKDDPKAAKNFKAFIGPDQIVFRPTNSITRKATIKLDAKKSPNTIDMTILLEGDKPGKTVRGIYLLEKDKLRICFPNFDSDAKGRPTEFKTKTGDGFTLITLTRSAAKK